MSKYYEDEEDDVLTSKEPQVTSTDPEERKAARAIRIKRRQEAIRKAEQPAEELATEEEPSLTEQATAQAAEELQRLALEGTAMVTNVKVTTDEREMLRRFDSVDKRKESLDMIEQLALDAQTQYEAVHANWEAMLKIRDPLEIDASMKEQKRNCDELLEQKEELIAHLKEELDNMDKTYYVDLNKQDNDIKELSDRIEKQVSIMQRAYEKQLGLIEVAINAEREVTMEHNNKRWESLYKLRDKEELQHIEDKADQLDGHQQRMEQIMWDHMEKYRNAKIELELLIQDLQKELEKLKATCLINTEKIGYNYQILKKREEENVFVRSQQKRKLNKMSDVANSLRKKIAKAAEEGAIEEMKADTEIVKLMQSMSDLEHKSYQFANVNDYRFFQVWRMCVSKCTELTRALRHVEVAVHAHVLAEPPPPPPPPPPKSPLIKPAPEANDSQIQTNLPVDEKNEFKDTKQRLVQHILHLVADNTGFLIEDRLLRLIEKYQTSSRNLCTLDAIFMALEIQSEEDIELLCTTFLDYAFCPICVGREDALTSQAPDQEADEGGSNTPKARASSVRARASVGRTMSCSTSRSVGFRGHELTPEEQTLMTEADEIIQKCGDPQAPAVLIGTSAEAAAATAGRRGGTRGVTVAVAALPALSFAPPPQVNPFLCPLGHALEIEPMQVLSALGDFITVFMPPEKQKLYDILESVKPPDFSTPSRSLKVEDIEQYWANWKNFFPPEKERFWEALLNGVNKYLLILQERQKLHDEVQILRARNAALRRLARDALPPLAAAPLPRAPGYLRPGPGGFIAATEDHAHGPEDRLPPI